MVIRACETSSDVIDALGGTTAVARLTGRPPQAVTNWRAKGRLPANTFLVLSTELTKAGFEAPAALWDMLPAADQAPNNGAAA